MLIEYSGGTKTFLKLFDEYGNVLGEGQTGPSNPWLLCGQTKDGHTQDGFVIVAKRLNDMIEESWQRVENKEEYRLVSVVKHSVEIQI